MKRAAVYMRVSTAGQEKEETHESQWAELDVRIQNDGAVLSPEHKYLDNGWSGAILERPDLDRMRIAARNKEFDVIYIYDRSRLARRFVYQEIVLDELENLGIEIISLHDVNGTTMEDKLMGGMMGLIYEFDRKKIAERMRLGKITKVRDKKKLLGYNPKYGYDYHRRIKGNNAEDGKLTINEEQAEVVRLIFSLYGEQQMSKYAIRAELFKLGIMPVKQKSKQWSTGVIDRMLRDKTYIGEHHYNKTESREPINPRTHEKYKKHLKGSRVARPQEQWYQVEVDPIMEDRQLFDKVQVLLERNKRLNPRNNKKNNYLLSGLLQCSCGFARTGDPSNGHTYYRCTDRLNHATSLRQCYERGINTTVVDALVWDNVKQMLSNPQLITDYAEKWQNNASPIESQVNILKKQIDSLNEQVERLLTLFTTGDISEQIYRTRKDDIATRRDKLVHEINDLESILMTQPKLPLEKLVCGVLELLEEPDFNAKREIIKTVITKVVATQKEINVWGFIPLIPQNEVGLNVKYSYAKVPNQYVASSNQESVGLDVEHRNSKVLTQLPFELKKSMPPTDCGKRGYSEKFTARLQSVN